jgi:hypothetical protein
MPLFFLNIHNGFGVAQDDEGVDLPDLAAAREKAVEGIRSILSEEIKAGTIDLGGHVEVADADGNVLAAVHFEDAFRILRSPPSDSSGAGR